MTNRELMQMALKELEKLCNTFSYPPDSLYDIINALRARLAQPEPDDGYCQACEGNYCTAKNGCVARDNPPQREVYCGCGDEIVSGDGAVCGTCVSVKYMEKNHG